MGCYTQPIHRVIAGAPVPDGGLRGSKLARIDTVGFLDLVGVTFARFERSVDMRQAGDRADAEWRDVRRVLDGMRERPIRATRTPVRFHRAAHRGGALWCLSWSWSCRVSSCRAGAVASCTEGSPRVPPRGALLDAGVEHGVSLDFAPYERRLPPLPAIVRHHPPSSLKTLELEG